MKNYVKAIIALALCMYLGIIYKSTAFILLGMAGAVFCVCSFVYLLLVRRKLQVSFSIPIDIVEEGNFLGLHMLFHQESDLWIGKLRLYFTYGKVNEKHKKKEMLAVYDICKGKQEQVVEVVPDTAGCYEFELLKYRIYDFLGLMYMELKCQRGARGICLPKLQEVPLRISEQTRNFYGESDVYDDLHPGQDVSETFQVRNYAPGDKMQSIHWKLSAKQEDLMVKDYGLPKACPVLLVIPEALSGEWLTYMAGLSFTLMDNRVLHFLIWDSREQEELVRARVEDEESFYLALTSYMESVSEKGSKDLFDRYKQKYSSELFLYEIEIRENEIWLNQKMLGKHPSEVEVFNL